MFLSLVFVTREGEESRVLVEYRQGDAHQFLAALDDRVHRDVLTVTFGDGTSVTRCPTDNRFNCNIANRSFLFLGDPAPHLASSEIPPSGNPDLVLVAPVSEEEEEDDNEEDDGEDREDDIIHDASYKPYPHFLPLSSEQELYLGVELETDYYEEGMVKTAAHALHDQDDIESSFYLKEDGSLRDGIEIVSHPATLEYHKQAFPWERICQIVEQYGGKSHDTGTCGLHVHFNKTFLGETDDEIDFNTLKLLFVVEKFWDNLVIFSRRDVHQLNQWAGKPDQKPPLQKRKGINHVKYLKGHSGKYRAVNLLNRRTIEIRIFRGTLNLPTFFATLELVDFLVRFVKAHSVRLLNKLTWADLIGWVNKKKYPALKQYLDAVFPPQSKGGN